MLLYPLLFKPTFHYRIWGGNKLKSFGKQITENNIGESWEISTIPGFVSEVSNGGLKGKNLNELIREYKEELIGENVYRKYGEQFPLLIKILDAAKPLSVQVHPNDEHAKKYHNSMGKTEMWYVLDAEPDSQVILGFEKGINKDIFYESIEKNTIENILRKIHPKKEDAIFIPSGTVHAMGKGISVVEIQQTSDVTYRIYDYNRVDKDGKKRNLHIQQAKEIADYAFIEEPFALYDKNENDVIIVKSPYFTTSRYLLKYNKKLEKFPRSFRILICTEGEYTLKNQSFVKIITKGQTVLLPASLLEIELIPHIKTTLLEVHID